MEVFAVLICCAIAAALGFFIGVTGELERTAALMIENNKLREPIKSEIQGSTVRRGATDFVLRDGTEITFDWSDSVVTIHRGDATNKRMKDTLASPVIVKKGRYSNNCRCHTVSKLKPTDVKEMP